LDSKFSFADKEYQMSWEIIALSLNAGDLVAFRTASDAEVVSFSIEYLRHASDRARCLRDRMSGHPMPWLTSRWCTSMARISSWTSHKVASSGIFQ